MSSTILRPPRVASKMKPGPLLVEHCRRRNLDPVEVLAGIERRERAEVILLRGAVDNLHGVDDEYDLDASVVEAVSPIPLAIHELGKPATLRCATCDYGRVLTPATSCRACVAHDHQERAIRALVRRGQLIDRLACQIGADREELVELIVLIGLSARGGVP